MGKIIAVIVVILLILVAVAAWRLLSVTPPTPPVNRAPTIQSVSADRGAAEVTTSVAFTVNATDLDGDTLTYEWKFGDGTNATTATATHTYALAGNFIAVVTVSDGEASVTSEANPIFMLVSHPETRAPPNPTDQPNPVAVVSADRSIIQAGQSVRFNGNSSWTWAYDAALSSWEFQSAADNETAIPTLNWTWGDGTAATSGTPTVAGEESHTFAAAGLYAVKLKATNYLSKDDTVGYTVLVTAAAPPAVGVKNPDVFTEVVFGEPDSLDPAYDYETSGGQVIQNVVETLIWYDREKADVFKPMLATKVPDLANLADVTADGLTYNFTLKSGVKFSSGTSVTCSVVKWSFTRALAITPPSGSIYPDLPTWILDQSLTGYILDDPLTLLVDERAVAIDAAVTCPGGPTGLAVQFHLVIPYPAFLATMAFTVSSILDPTPSSYRVTSRCPSTDLSVNYCHDQLVGTGPFKLRAWMPNQQIILDRNANYHRAVANFKEVHILKANDVATRVLMLKAGDADFIDLPTNHKNDILDGAGNPLPGITYSSGETFIVQFLGFNRNINTTAGAPTDDVPAGFFADLNMRKAFAHAWKYTDFINNVLYGFGFSLCSAIPKGMLGYDATVPCYTHDLVKTRQYMENATDSRPGNPGGGPDTYWDNGFRFTVYYNNGNTVREEGARQLKSTIEGLNALRTGLPPFTIDVQGLEWSTFLSTVRNKIPAMFFLGWAPDYADPDDYVLPFLHTNQTYPARVGYSNTTLDALIEAQAMELNQATRLNMLKTIQLAPYYDLPYIFMYQSKSFNVMRTWVTGFYENPMTTAGTGNYYYDLNK
jgi:peptide/nickel transport system substrate-binding protein